MPIIELGRDIMQTNISMKFGANQTIFVQVRDRTSFDVPAARPPHITRPFFKRAYKNNGSQKFLPRQDITGVYI